LSNRLAWSSQLALTQHDYPNGRDQNEHGDNLKGEIVIFEQQQTNIADVVHARRGEGREWLLRHFRTANDGKNLDQQRKGNEHATPEGEPIDFAYFLGAQIEQHNDE